MRFHVLYMVNVPPPLEAHRSEALGVATLEFGRGVILFLGICWVWPLPVTVGNEGL